jgi:uncharacterized protein YdhG (YjbR/CyaY superfamily)
MKKVKAGARRVSGKTGAPPRNVDDYLAVVPDAALDNFIELRSAVRSAVPKDAVEIVSYGILAFKQKRMLVWFGAFSSHCSLYPTASIIEAFKDDLKGFSTSKGTIHFPNDKPVPVTLVKKLVKERVAQDAKGKAR